MTSPTTMSGAMFAIPVDFLALSVGCAFDFIAGHSETRAFLLLLLLLLLLLFSCLACLLLLLLLLEGTTS